MTDAWRPFLIKDDFSTFFKASTKSRKSENRFQIGNWYNDLDSHLEDHTKNSYFPPDPAGIDPDLQPSTYLQRRDDLAVDWLTKE